MVVSAESTPVQERRMRVVVPAAVPSVEPVEVDEAKTSDVPVAATTRAARQAVRSRRAVQAHREREWNAAMRHKEDKEPSSGSHARDSMSCG